MNHSYMLLRSFVRCLYGATDCIGSARASAHKLSCPSGSHARTPRLAVYCSGEKEMPDQDVANYIRSYNIYVPKHGTKNF